MILNNAIVLLAIIIIMYRFVVLVIVHGIKNLMKIY